MKTQKKRQPAKYNVVPLVVLGVLVIAAMILVAGGGSWFGYATKKPATKTAAAQNANRTSSAATDALLGASPPNQIGSPTAAVTVEEFADFQCPACASVYPMLKDIQQTYAGRIRFIFRHFPLQMHDRAYDAAVAAEAAAAQGSEKFWAMQNLLFTNQKSWSSDPNYKQLFVDYARQLELDIDKFQTDSAGRTSKTRVDQDISRGRSLNVSSTPTIYINGQMIPFDQVSPAGLTKAIDAELQKVQPANAPAR